MTDRVVHIRMDSLCFVCGFGPIVPDWEFRARNPRLVPTCLLCVVHAPAMQLSYEAYARLSRYGAMMDPKDEANYESQKPLIRPYYEEA